MHVVPPCVSLDFVAGSALADETGWVETDRTMLQHPRFPNIFSLGDVCSAPNAKTAAAVRKQAPIVAENALAMLDGRKLIAAYDGYGTCPLPVARCPLPVARCPLPQQFQIH